MSASHAFSLPSEHIVQWIRSSRYSKAKSSDNMCICPLPLFPLVSCFFAGQKYLWGWPVWPDGTTFVYHLTSIIHQNNIIFLPVIVLV
jgi:hypothetical protein